MGNFYLLHEIEGNRITVIDRDSQTFDFTINQPWDQFLPYLDKFTQLYIETNKSATIDSTSLLVIEPNYLIAVTSVIDAISCPRRNYVKNLGADETVSRDINRRMTFGNLLHRALSHRISFDTSLEQAITDVIDKSKVDLLTSNISEKEAHAYFDTNYHILSGFQYKEGETELDSQNWKYGLTGKFDAITPNTIYEFKSSAIPDTQSPWPNHNLQMRTYLDMMTDTKQYQGNVLYIHDGEMGLRHPTDWSIHNTILARNYVYLVWTGQLIPPVLRGENKRNCKNCYVKTGCWNLCAGLNTQRDCSDCFHEADCSKIRWQDPDIQYFTKTNEALYLEENENQLEQYIFSNVNSSQPVIKKMVNKGNAIICTNKVSEMVRDGKFISVYTVSAEYTSFRDGDFTRAYPFADDTETKISLFYTTIIIKITTKSIILESSNPLPKEIIVVPSNVSAQIRLARRSIFELIKSNHHFLELLSKEKGIDKQFPEINMTPLPKPLKIYNSAQFKAIKLCLTTEDIMLVQGPAGTGKTSVIVELINQLFNNGKSVLCAAYTNMAVDNVATKLSDANIPFLRLGNQYSIDRNIRDHGILEQQSKYTEFIDSKISIPILSTTSTIANKDYSHINFDYVVLDEAAQMTEPESLKAIIKGAIAILVGDHAQLQPIVKSEKAKDINLHVSLFERLTIQYPQRFIRLIEQYRMNDEILSFPNQRFYEGQLVSANIEIATHRYSVFQGKYLNNSPYQILALEDNEISFNSQVNLNEALVVVRLVAEIINSENIGVEDIGIIAPFRAQVALLRSLLPGLDVDTVDRFQGSERNIIILSTVIIDEIPLLSDPRRLNVALTRAKKKLIVLISNPDVEKSSSNLLYAMYCDARNRGLLQTLSVSGQFLSETEIVNYRDKITEHFDIITLRESLGNIFDKQIPAETNIGLTGIYYNSIQLVEEESMNVQCQICRLSVSLGVQCPGCLYWFHKDHLIPWVVTNSSCPICKHTIRILKSN